jgi:putative oxidoreductase
VDIAPRLDAADLGLLVLRLAVGLTFAAHGAQKAFGWWAGPGWIGWQKVVGRMGFRPPELFAAISIGAELVGGLLLALGIVTPLAAAILLAQSVVIVVKVHAPSGFWAKEGGFEYPLALGVGALAVGLIGPGLMSVDGLVELSAPDAVRVVLVIAGLLAGTIALALPTAARSSDTKGPAASAR